MRELGVRRNLGSLSVSRWGLEGCHLGAKLGGLLHQRLVLLQLALQKANGDAGLGLNAAVGEAVGVGELVVAVPEVGSLDPTALHECVDAAVEAADADAEDLGELPLAGLRLLRLLREVLERAVTQVIAEVTANLDGGLGHATALP